MENLIVNNAFLIILLPFWICLIVMCGRFFSVYVNKLIIYSLTALSSFLGILFCGTALKNINEPLIQTFDFIKIKNFTIACGLYIDKLSLIIDLVLFLVSLCVLFFCIPHM